MTDQPLNQPAELPPELDRWNWGAFFLNWIWGIGNSVFIALLMFVPLVNIVMIFVLGARGSRWAWRNRAWRDADHFRKVQRKWTIAGIIVWLAVSGLIAAMVLSISAVMKNSEAFTLTMETTQSNRAVQDALGLDIKAGFWISGNVEVNAGGSGAALFTIPVTGSRGTGTVYSRALRSNGLWQLRFLMVSIQGQTTPIVLINEDNLPIPQTGTET